METAVTPSGPRPDFAMIALDEIRESDFNPRKTFREIESLAADIKMRGILQPILVRPRDGHYELVFGSRRFRAAKLAGLQAIPAGVREMSDGVALETQIIENSKREDVHPLEESLGYAELMKRAGYDVPAIAARVGKSESFVYQRLKLIDLIEPAKKALMEDRITAGHAILIARLQPKDQKEALEACFDRYQRDENGKPVMRSVRHIGAWIHENIHLDLQGSPFDKREADLLPAAGACTTCSKRTGFVPQLFPDVAKKDTCTDRACYEQKMQAHIARKKADLEATGEKVRPVSSDDHYNLRTKEEKKLLSRDRYSLIGKGDHCEHAEKAIVVHGYGKRGQVLDICADPNCKVHSRRGVYHRDPRELAKRKAEEAKRRREIDIRRRTLAEVLGRVPVNLSREDLDFIAIAHLHEMQQDTKKVLCERHGWEPIKAQCSRDWQAPIEKQIPLVTQQELERLLIEMSLVGELLISTWQTIGKPKFLSAIAERYGVKVKAIEKAVDREIAEKEARKAKKTKAAKTRTKRPKTGKNRLKPETKRGKSETEPLAAETPPLEEKEPPIGMDSGRSAGPSCERCGCTHLSPCPDGCGWDPLFLMSSRHVCSKCAQALLLKEAEEATAKDPSYTGDNWKRTLAKNLKRIKANRQTPDAQIPGV